MLYLCLGSALVYLISIITNSVVLYQALVFDRSLILRGQVWRLISYPLTYNGGNIFYTLIGLVCYYSLGRAMENIWGTLKFNLFYLSGVVMMDIYCMIFGGFASVTYLNLSMLLGYATLYPQAQFLLFFIIPIRAWVLALVDLVIVLVGVLANDFPSNLFSVISLANYFLFFGKDVLNLLPMSWRVKLKRKTSSRPSPSAQPKVIPFRQEAAQKPNYLHRCTICGRTDVTNPELEFRYCSRCNGYYCYCQDHINNHTHIQ